MAGNKLGALKARTGFGKKGYKPGAMINEMNVKMGRTKKKISFGAIGNEIGKVAAQTAGVNMDWSGERRAIRNIGGSIKRGVGLAGNIGKAFVRNATGGDIKKVLKKRKK